MDSIDSYLPMMLPKGIVINTTSVYKEVASYHIVPADKIWEYWHVYTTTNKKLKDPTARRLENFWWQVWGSDRRNLSGAALAKLYEEISVGPTFVPLRGPSNRWEGPDVPPLTKELILAHLGQGPLPDMIPSCPSSTTSIMNDPSPKGSVSSASKPPPAHPILKKSRGPSSSGPRPTARFISPHRSADDDDETEVNSSDSVDGADPRPSHLNGINPSKQAGAKPKKFVASTAVTKHRPGLPRRTSPQSPLASEINLQENESTANSRISKSQRPVSPIPESPQKNVDSITNGGKPSMNGAQDKPLSAKAAGKRPVLQRRITPDAKSSRKSEGRKSQKSSDSTTGQATTSQLRRASDVPQHARATSDSSRGIENLSSQKMGRSQSYGGYDKYSSANKRSTAPLKNGLFTGATASTTTETAQGTIIDQSGLGSLPPPSTLDPRPQSNSTLSSRTSASSLADYHFTPTQPTTSASVPMGRTKSQLTLLLEREKSRTDHKLRAKGGKNK